LETSRVSKLAWIRVSKRHPCPICESTHWCSYSPEENLAVCMRVTSEKPCKSGGYFHPLDADVVKKLPKKVYRPPQEVQDFARHAVACERALNGLNVLAASLDVSERSLRRLHVGWDVERQAYTFPMRYPYERIIGIHLRYPHRKLALTGSHNGLFWPDDLPIEGLLMVCEGPTDCAALLDLGYAAVGRVGCLGSAEMIQGVLRIRRRPVVIVSDNDEPKTRPDGTLWYPGQEGAAQLAKDIKGLAQSVKVIKPPWKKDIRAMVQSGGTRKIVEHLINNTRFS
jgi:hypothetical protein